MKDEKKGRKVKGVVPHDLKDVLTEEDVATLKKWGNDPRVKQFKAAADVLEDEIFSLSGLSDLLISSGESDVLLENDTLTNISILVKNMAARMQNNYETLRDAFNNCTIREKRYAAEASAAKG